MPAITYAIKQRIELAIVAALDAVLSPVVVRAGQAVGELSVPATGLVAVTCTNYSSGSLGAKNIQVAAPADVFINCYTLLGRDKTGTVVNALEAAVVDAIGAAGFPAALLTADAGLTLLGPESIAFGGVTNGDGDTYRGRIITLSIFATLTT